MKKIWLKSVCVMSNLKGFATQDRRPSVRLVSQPKTTHNTDLHDTHMDPKYIQQKKINNGKKKIATLANIENVNNKQAKQYSKEC